MSLADLKLFLKSIHPFELLSQNQLQSAADAINIAYYKKDTVLIDPQNPPNFFYIVIKGEVAEYQEGEFVKNYQHYSSFDADSLIYQTCEHTFVVTEELICYELPKSKFLNLIESNESFKSYFLTDLAEKIQRMKKKEYATQMSDFMVARVCDVYLREPCLVEEGVTLREAIFDSLSKGVGSILVKKGGELGIITDSDIKKFVLKENFDLQTPCAHIARFPAITIEKDDFLFNALLLLTKHSIKRIAVVENSKVIGILQQLDLLSYFANHTHLVLVQINSAKNKEELKTATLDFIHIIRKLNAKGVKPEHIARLISELNDKVYEKLYNMIVPQDIAQKGSLLAMGSEGRKEQILRTDQDNALIVEDEIDAEIFKPYMDEFSAALVDFGFPACPGNIMVSNNYWRKSVSGFKKELYKWFDSPTQEDLMNLAIFFDSICVGGNKALLDEVRNYIFEGVENRDNFMANFAKSSLFFETPIGIFTNFVTERGLLDLKKGGIFPIVQGVRSLALKHKIKETDTFTRLRKLKELKVLDEKFEQEIYEAFDTFQGIRLKEGLWRVEQGKSPTNMINPKKLSSIEIDLLKESFRIVNKFKKFLTYHFKLNMVT